MDCPKCDKIFSSEQGLKIHYGRMHEGTISGVVINCTYCNEPFRTDKYRLERSKNLFCSTSCHDKWRSDNISGSDAGGWNGGKTSFNCYTCGEISKKWKCRLDESDKNFCSDECLNTYKSIIQRGEGYPSNWRNLKRWKNTASKIRQRDEYKCTLCKNSKNLEVHHITPVSAGGKKYDPFNLTTLCKSCHRTGENAVHSSPHYKNY